MGVRPQRQAVDFSSSCAHAIILPQIETASFGDPDKHSLSISAFELMKSRSISLAIVMSIRSQYTISMAVIVGVQALYAVRIWKFGRHFHVVLPWCAFLSVAASLATGIYAVYSDYGPHNLLSLTSIRVPIDTVYATTAATDLIIAGIMCFYLHKGREMTRMSSTIKIVVVLLTMGNPHQDSNSDRDLPFMDFQPKSELALSAPTVGRTTDIGVYFE
ncbi:hypothetical protein EV421DRAFT_2044063 [Armillaria borealis]|uniref:Uncharacterized protein n=1 Tax=Armillaria borealis TaxID=47425 RepID=A0AA39M5E3_9AGAR|nr:hypothetical protein EV421DRAFT_2044063 [Armillaria borealis]